MENTVLISERESRSLLFRLPSLKIQLTTMGILSLLYVLNFPLNEISTYLIILSLVFIPSILSVFILPYLRSYKVKMNLRQSGFITLFSLLSSLIFYWILIFVGLSFERSFLISIAFPVSIRFITITGAFQYNFKKSLTPSLLQSLLPLPLFQIFYNIDLWNISGYLITLLIGLGFVLVLIPIINKPFEKDFGIPTLKLVNIITKTILGEKGGKEELEEFFEKNSILGDIEYTIYSFRTEDEKRYRALFVIPGFHPGPLRGVGGSRLSTILSEELKDHEEVFTFHAPSTHPLNPVREEDCKILSKSIKKDLKRLNYSNRASRFIRKEKNGIVGAQRFGDSVLTNLSFYPKPAEDVHASVGKMISQIGKSNGFSNVGIIDSHNSGERGVSSIVYPTKRTKRIINLSLETFKDVEGLETNKFKMGTSSQGGYEESGIGHEGIKAAVFEVNGQISAQIVVDANNMEKGLRGKIQKGIEDLVDISELHTTDTHEINTLLHSHQPLGAKISSERLIKDIRKLLEEAIRDLEPVDVGVTTNTLKDVELMGPINTDRLNAVSETIASTIPYTLILTFSLLFLLTLFIFSVAW
ncbi:MAG: DUF2070 family protein [Candidatus Natronoplasma sp.]